MEVAVTKKGVAWGPVIGVPWLLLGTLSEAMPNVGWLEADPVGEVLWGDSSGLVEGAETGERPAGEGDLSALLVEVEYGGAEGETTGLVPTRYEDCDLRL